MIRLDDQQMQALLELISYISVIIVIIVIMSMVLPIAFGESRNVTLTIERGDLHWCYNGKNSMQCNMMNVDNNNFRLLSNFLEYLNSGIVEMDKKK